MFPKSGYRRSYALSCHALRYLTVLTQLVSAKCVARLVWVQQWYLLGVPASAKHLPAFGLLSSCASNLIGFQDLAKFASFSYAELVVVMMDLKQWVVAINVATQISVFHVRVV